MLRDNLTLPKMILFDYGHTLLYESGFDDTKGYEALLPYLIKNENNLTVKEIATFSNKLFMDIGEYSWKKGIEIHDHIFRKLMREYMGLEFSLSPDEAACIFWEAAAPGTPMPKVEKLIACMNARGIRSGVISNISFSEKTLAERINRLLPKYKYEFIIASSEYVYRKPNKILFELALRKAHLKPEEVWFCGDHPEFDIKGAASVGILPVWYQSELVCPYRNNTEDEIPEVDHIHIRDWEELCELLQTL